MAESGKKSYYAMDMETIGIEFYLKINDVTLFTDVSAEGLKVTSPVNDWIFGGANNFEIVLYEPKMEKEDEEQPVVAKMSFKFYTVDFSGEYPQADEVLWEVKFPSVEIPKLPYSINRKINIIMPPESSLWLQAENIENKREEAITETKKLIKKYTELISSNKLEEAFEMMSYKFSDYSKANGFQFDRIREVVLKQYQNIPDNDFKYENVPPNMLEFNIEGYGKILHAFRKDDFPAIVFTDPQEDDCIGMSVYVAKIGREWKFVR